MCKWEVWEKLSEDALRSNRMSMLSAPVSAEVRRLLVTLTSVVAVLWSVQKPDWRGSN